MECLESTYEEWKLFVNPPKFRTSYNKCLESTYEEWKLIILNIIFSTHIFTFRIYLWGMKTHPPEESSQEPYSGLESTYEEWKRMLFEAREEPLLLTPV